MSDAPGFVFGYGSLIEERSRGRNLRDASAAIPVRVRGVRRAWDCHGPGPGLSCTFLGAAADQAASCNGVLARVAAGEWEGLDRRERGYRREELPRDAIDALAGGGLPEGSVCFYATESSAAPSADRPLIQSYIDICLEGCLRVGEQLGVGESFAEEFLRTTDGWSPHWVNDRLFPRAPFRNVPDAAVIDRLLQAHAPGAFAAISVE